MGNSVRKKASSKKVGGGGADPAALDIPTKDKIASIRVTNQDCIEQQENTLPDIVKPSIAVEESKKLLIPSPYNADTNINYCSSDEEQFVEARSSFLESNKSMVNDSGIVNSPKSAGVLDVTTDISQTSSGAAENETIYSGALDKTTDLTDDSKVSHNISLEDIIDGITENNCADELNTTVVFNETNTIEGCGEVIEGNLLNFTNPIEAPFTGGSYKVPTGNLLDNTIDFNTTRNEIDFNETIDHKLLVGINSTRNLNETVPEEDDGNATFIDHESDFNVTQNGEVVNSTEYSPIVDGTDNGCETLNTTCDVIANLAGLNLDVTVFIEPVAEKVVAVNTTDVVTRDSIVDSESLYYNLVQCKSASVSEEIPEAPPSHEEKVMTNGICEKIKNDDEVETHLNTTVNLEQLNSIEAVTSTSQPIKENLNETVQIETAPSENLNITYNPSVEAIRRCSIANLNLDRTIEIVDSIHESISAVDLDEFPTSDSDNNTSHNLDISGDSQRTATPTKIASSDQDITTPEKDIASSEETFASPEQEITPSEREICSPDVFVSPEKQIATPEQVIVSNQQENPSINGALPIQSSINNTFITTMPSVTEHRQPSEDEPMDGVEEYESRDITPSPPIKSMKCDSNRQIQSKTNGVFHENIMQDNLNVTFKTPSLPNWTSPPVATMPPPAVPNNTPNNDEANYDNEVFVDSKQVNFQQSDLDYLVQSDTANNPPRESVLLKFDPLFDIPSTAETIPQQARRLPNVSEESGDKISSRSFHPATVPKNGTIVRSGVEPAIVCRDTTSDKVPPETVCTVDSSTTAVINNNSSVPPVTESITTQQPEDNNIEIKEATGNETMSLDVINDMKLENNDTKTFESINTSDNDGKQSIRMAEKEFERKLKNDTKTKLDEQEKKMRNEYESREEAFIKRITEKDKTIAKMNQVIEAYEKTIAELVAEKEQIAQNYEKKQVDLRYDSEQNLKHLLSLESTFNDLNAKYERSKQMTMNLQRTQQTLEEDKSKLDETLTQQELRYEKMKNHAIGQLEIANAKLENNTKMHTMDMAKMKANYKKEEINRIALQEQLQQKIKENEELVKICDELINGGGS